MITTYKQEKEKVLKMYDDFNVIVRESGFPQDNKSLVALKNQVENIKNDKFVLMIAGEAKSGKSTFINAFLGQEILPMGPLQCTSAIIEIKYGNTFSLKATYADNRTRELSGEEDIKKFLTENAALNDEFREIPVTTINNEILIKYKGKIPKRVIDDLVAGVQNDNIYGLSHQEYEKKIRSYIERNKDNWTNIVTKMVITYKFEDESLRGIEIIDSPGVNAQGRVGDVTDNYIENANAIMFLKPITGAALESSSFRSFLDSKSVERNSKALFLILTRIANESPENLEKLQSEALKLYGKTVSEQQIICVDSKIELFINKIASHTVEEIEESLDKFEAAGDTFYNPPRSITRNFSKDKYIDYLKNKSNFSNIDQALNIFGRRSHYLALSEFMERMIKVCEKIQDNLEEQINLNRLKMKDPSELASQIADIKRKINEINAKMGKTVDEIVVKYTSDSGIVRIKAKEAVKEFESQIESISLSSENAINELEKITFKKIDESKSFQEMMQKNIVAECNQALITLSNEQSINYTSLEPDFTPETFEEMKKTTELSANVDRSYETGKTFKKTHYYSEYSRKEHFKILKPDIMGRINVIQNKAINNLIAFANSTSEIYIKELSANAKTKKEELDRIMEEKKNAEELKLAIEHMNVLLVQIHPLVSNAKEIKGGIDSNVQ